MWGERKNNFFSSFENTYRFLPEEIPIETRFSFSFYRKTHSLEKINLNSNLKIKKSENWLLILKKYAFVFFRLAINFNSQIPRYCIIIEEVSSKDLFWHCEHRLYFAKKMVELMFIAWNRFFLSLQVFEMFGQVLKLANF